MQLDRHEQYVLRTLAEKYNIGTRKLTSLTEHHRLLAAYAFRKNGDTVCSIFIDNYPVGIGGASCHPEKENKNVERIGRMIAFTRAALDALEIPPLTGEVRRGGYED